MIQSNTYKIYTLSAPNQEQIRYIGMTCQSVHKRLNHHVNVMYPSHKTNWIKNLKLNGLLPVINVIDEGLTHDEAAYMEQQYIKLYKAAGAQLTNMIKGGTGTPGHKVTDEAKQKLKDLWTGSKHTDEAKKKMSDHQKKHGNPFSGKTHTEESRKRMSIATTGKNLGESNPSKRPDVKDKISKSLKGRVFSDEWKKKISQSRLRNGSSEKQIELSKISIKSAIEATKRSVSQYDKQDNFIKTFNSIAEANAELKITSNNISSACRGKLKTAYGFIWKYAKKEN